MVASTTPVRQSIAREDYLQTIMQLSEDDIPVIRARLAERLGVSAPSVSEAIRGLVDDGLVELQDRKRIRLTQDGRRVADNIVRRHRVAERILVDLLGMSWYEAHEEAHRLEHGLSDRVVERALEVLGNPTTCPHGSPIPGSGYDDPEAVPILELAAGHKFRLERVAEGIEVQGDVMQYFDQKGFRPGVRGQIMTVAPDGSLSVMTDSTTVSIGPGLGAHIHVTRI